MSMICVPETYKVVQALNPATDAAGRTGTYVSLKNVNRAYIVCNITQGVATTIALTPYQATAVAGTSVKVLTNNIPIWINADTSTSDTLTKQSDALTFTTDSGIKNKVVVFQIDPQKLDINNEFDCITIVTGASSASNITSAVYLLDMKTQKSTPPSAITD